MAAVYEEIYRDLLEDPGRVTRQESLRLDGAARHFFAFDFHDLVYQARSRQWHAMQPWTAKLKHLLTRIAGRCRILGRR